MMSDGLLDYIKSIEGEYEVSIVVKPKYRRLPRLSVRRDVQQDINEEGFDVETYHPIHRWIDELEKNDMAPIVTNELKTLIDKVARIGEILCESKEST